jgi:hypothetical protein
MSKPSEGDAFVVTALHQHLKEQLGSAPRETENGRGRREALLDALGFLDGVSGGRFPSSIETEDGAQ